MESQGTLSPASVEEARAAFEAVGPTAQRVVRESAKAMEFDREEYRERVTSDVVERARNVLFAHRLAVTVGSRAEFESWLDDHPDYEVETIGSDDVERVAWHAAPFAETVLAATFQNEPEAAVETLRRQAFGELYRPRFEGSGADAGRTGGHDEDDDNGEDGGDGDADEAGADR